MINLILVNTISLPDNAEIFITKVQKKIHLSIILLRVLYKIKSLIKLNILLIINKFIQTIRI
ncbi:hypothetical protein COF58_19780 [Bacillus wiedmannii]|nr:hypothetical protein COF58_19780 [Bacillus wiedmannii]